MRNEDILEYIRGIIEYIWLYKSILDFIFGYIRAS